MHNRRKSTLGRTPLRWLLPLWGVGAGCFIDLPERYTDGGVELIGPDALSGMAPGTTPDSPGTKPPRSPDPDQGVAGVGPPPPPASQVPSDGPPPPPVEPTEPPSDPPVACVPGVCHTCDGERVVPMPRDARCESTDCVAFPLYAPGIDPGTGVEVCNLVPSQMATDCDDAGQCKVASYATCTEPAAPPVPVLSATACQHVVDCVTQGNGHLELVPAGQACIGRAGVCDGFGICRGAGEPGDGAGAELCEHLPLSRTLLGDTQTFCEARSDEGTVCRFAIQLGSSEADPSPLDVNPEANCGHFCSHFGWTCVAAFENDDFEQCAFHEQSPDRAFIANGCDRTLEFDLHDGVDARNGILCECRLP